MKLGYITEFHIVMDVSPALASQPSNLASSDSKSPAPGWLFELLRPVELYTLIVLAEHPNYPYGIAAAIPSNIHPSLGATVAGVRKALQRMRVKGWVVSYPGLDQTGRNEQAYTLTDYGRAQLEFELSRLHVILDAGRVALVRLSLRSQI